MAFLDQWHATLRAAERVIAEARGIVHYWDDGLTVVQIAALREALDAYDAVRATQVGSQPTT